MQYICHKLPTLHFLWVSLVGFDCTDGAVAGQPAPMQRVAGSFCARESQLFV